MTERHSLAMIGVVSTAALSFLVWLIYFATPVAGEAAWISALPTVNACFNATSSICMVAGVMAIRRQRRSLHVKLMLGALLSSVFFLLSYVAYHTFHGDTKFLGQGPVRAVYFAILISHILLSIVVLPMLLSTVFFAASGRFEKHKRLAKLTFPVWLYVSVTGVIVYFFLRAYY